jgi:phage gp16-like protein
LLFTEVTPPSLPELVTEISADVTSGKWKVKGKRGGGGVKSRKEQISAHREKGKLQFSKPEGGDVWLLDSQDATFRNWCDLELPS